MPLVRSSQNIRFAVRSATIFSNKNPTQRTKVSNNPAPGLFSIPGLHSPSDFLALARAAIVECNSIRENLAQRPEVVLSSQGSPVNRKEVEIQNSIGVLHELDSLSIKICNVIDAAELCRSVHSSAKWREAASNVFHELSDFITDLNADETLYECLQKHVTSDAEIFCELSEEQQRMAILLKSEFERDGIHLPKAERNELKRMVHHITNLESLFTNNITTRKKFYKLDRNEALSIIPGHILASVVPEHERVREGINEVTVSTDTHITNTFLKYSASSSLRKEAFMQSNTSCLENLEVLAALVEQRHQVALKLGFKNYADRFLRDKMAQNQETVYKFLNKMNLQVKQRMKHELELLSNAKKMIEGTNDLCPWDLPFYTGLIKAQKYRVDTSMLSQYLSIQNCIEGMKILVKSLFGIRIEECDLTKEESWCVDGGDEGIDDTSRAGLRKLIFYDSNNEQMIGTLYLDLYPRKDKYVHAAHFTIRCGCTVKSSVDEVQLPVVALVCNLSAPNKNNVSLLSHSEAETLFHEFGHALHSMLSRTSFQHVSGTRAAVDFVETPSHLMENYCWNPMFLKAIGTHHNGTGDTVPDDLLKNLVSSRFAFQGLEIQTQIVYAMFDQKLFGDPTSITSTELFAQLHKQNHLPYAEGTFWHSRFGHLVTYGAGYYGYLYDQVFAADIWKQGFADDPLSRTNGERLWKELLIHGGARDPNIMLRNFLCREPSVDAFFECFKM